MKKLILLPIILFLSLSQISAKSWHFKSIHIKADVLSDGSLHVNEARSYDFNGDFHWADYELSGLENQQITGFTLKDDQQTYEESSSEDPGNYQTETAGNRFYIRWHYDASDEIKTFYLDYTITNVIHKYKDIAELYFKFIGEANPEWADTVSIEIHLPQPATFGEVQAWAHGPLWGNVMFRNNNILLTIGKLPKNQYVEARVIFPPHWVSAITAIDSSAKKTILAKEKEFAEKANQLREQSILNEQIRKEKNARAYNIALPLAFMAVLIFIFLYWHYGRSFDVNYTQKIDANIPDDDHPAILNCIYFNNNVTGSTLSTTLFYLAQNGLIKIEKDENRSKKWYESSDPVILTLDRDKWQEQKDNLNDFENDLTEFLFNTIAKGENQVTSKMMRKASSKMQKWFRKWQKMIRVHLKDQPYFERESIKGSIINAVLSLAIVGASVFVLTSLGTNGLISLVVSIITSILSIVILRYTPDIKYLKLRLAALRRYLKTFGTASYQPSDLYNISDYFLFAIALGTGKKALQNLLNVVPPDEHAVLFPWFVYGGAGSPADFAAAVSSVVNAAAGSVSSAAGAGGGMSGAAGAGGGAGGAAGGAG